jgi:cytochrome P450
MNSKSASPALKLPPRARGHWLLGSLPDIQRDPLTALHDLWKNNGDLFRFKVFFYTGYLASHPNYVRHILVENHTNYNKENIDYQLLKPLVGEGLLTSNGDFWLRQRRLMQPAFHRRRIHGFGTVMTDTVYEMLERWEEPARQGQALDISQEMMRLTLAIAGRTLFSQDVSGAAGRVGQSFAILNEDIATRFRQLFSPPLSWPTPKNRRFHAAKADLDQVVDEIIQTRRQTLKKGEPAPDDLLTMLVEARDEETGQGMDDRQLRDEVMTLLLAGHETTANAASWTWYLLSEHPEVWQRLQAELQQVLGGCTPCIEDLPNLKYTDWVIQEAMRLYPPAWIISRRAIHDDEIGGCAIPAGSDISMSSYLVHRHPAFWNNPDRFDPERFSPERSANRPAYAYFPFGGGPRLCIGRDFANVEARLILAAVAQKYQPVLVEGHPVEPEALITLRPRFGLQMHLRPIHH